ncbi:MAG: SLATT domain-containing protein [Bdellovibrionales bacterium]|nr:SLATT domain-containing protein [Nitrosomonas nitrosa]
MTSTTADLPQSVMTESTYAPSVDELKGKAEFLKNKTRSSIDGVKKMLNKHKRKAAVIKIASILLSGTATILLGLQIAGLVSVFKDIAFVLGAFVTLLNALEPFFNYRALWLESEIGKANLYRLADDLEYYLAGANPEKLDIGVLNNFQQRHDEIWNMLSGAWQGHRRLNA